MQFSENVESLAIGPTLCEPLVDFDPLQAPEAAQLLTLALVQVNVVEPFIATPSGFADRLAEGAPAVTVTLAVLAALPPAPEHVSVKLELVVNAPVLWLPDVALVPLQDPLAVQLVAFVVLQVSCADDPD